MDAKIRKQLEEARSRFYSWRLVDAYNILRRFYDRLPFQPEKEHAEYVGIFARILVELGKEHELQFYVGELEKWHAKLKTPAIAYPLGVIYSYLPTPRREASRALFERILSDPAAGEYHVKARMMLADYFLCKGDIPSCRMMIDAIPVDIEDPQLSVLSEIWRAIVAREEKKFSEAIERLCEVLRTVSIEKDWYAYVSARITLAVCYIRSGNCDRGHEVVEDVKKLLEGRNFKSLRLQISTLETALNEKSRLGILRCSANSGEKVFTYDNRSLPLRCDTPAEKLMTLLARRRFLDKTLIVRSLYDRQYTGEQDDKLVYYHIHSLRKRLNVIGLPSEAIASEGNGYRLVPEVVFS